MGPTTSDKPGPEAPTPEAQALTVVMSRGQNSDISPPNEPVKIHRARNFQRYKDSSPSARLFANMATHAGRAPVALFYNLANGFHNAPEHLLADGSVRKRGEIDNLKSGLKVAGREAVMNTYDAFSGLVRCPYDGYKGTYCEDEMVTFFNCHHPKAKADRKAIDKLLGLATGTLRGIVGFPIKLAAAALAIPGYSLKGLEREVQARQDGVAEHAGRVKNVVVKQRIGQMLHASQTDQDLHWMRSTELVSGNPVVDARVWQTHRETKVIRQNKDGEGKKVEELILKAWDQLAIDPYFLGLNKIKEEDFKPVDM